MALPETFRNERATALKIFMSLLLVYAFFTNTYLTTNDASRFSLTVALTDRGSGEITDILPRVISPGWRPLDFAVKDGRVYSDKAPLGSFIAVPVYWACSRSGMPMRWVVFFVSLLTSGVLTALTAVLLFKVAGLWRMDDFGRIAIALAYGLGTMALVYGTVFFSSAITAFCGFASFYLLLKTNDSARPVVTAAAAGLLAGAAVLSDYYAAITAGCLLMYCLLSSPRRLIPMLLGFSVSISLLLLYNQMVFGAAWPLSYRYSSLFPQLHSTGFFGINLPGIKLPAQIAKMLFSFDSQGWGFVYANLPVVLAAVMMRRFMLARKEALLLIVMSAGYLYLIGSESWFDAYSVRFLMPLLPFAMLPLVCLKFSRRLERNLFLFMMGIAVMITFVGADLFIAEFMLERSPGMQNIAGMLLSKHGIRLELANWVFVLPAFIPLFYPVLFKRKSAK